jgi:hypothetical protein
LWYSHVRLRLTWGTRVVRFGGFFDFDGSAGWGDVGAGFGNAGPGFFVEVADEAGGFADTAAAGGVGGGEVEALVEGVGALLGDEAGGQRVDNGGDGDLDGVGVFERGKREGDAVGDAAGMEVDLVAVGVVAVLEVAVEVAEDGRLEGDGSALEAVGFDVAAEVDLHGCSLPPPRGV